MLYITRERYNRYQKMANVNEDEKPSKTRQWQERSDRPIAARPMTPREIEEHRINLVQSYQCADSDITFGFQKIQDENDTDRDDCLWLRYTMKCVVSGRPAVREIFSIKLPIPEEVRKMGEKLKQEQMRRGGGSRSRAAVKPMALPGPDTISVVGTVNDGVNANGDVNGSVNADGDVSSVSTINDGVNTGTTPTASVSRPRAKRPARKQ